MIRSAIATDYQCTPFIHNKLSNHSGHIIYQILEQILK